MLMIMFLSWSVTCSLSVSQSKSREISVITVYSYVYSLLCCALWSVDGVPTFIFNKGYFDSDFFNDISCKFINNCIIQKPLS